MGEAAREYPAGNGWYEIAQGIVVLPLRKLFPHPVKTDREVHQIFSAKRGSVVRNTTLARTKKPIAQSPAYASHWKSGEWWSMTTSLSASSMAPIGFRRITCAHSGNVRASKNTGVKKIPNVR